LLPLASGAEQGGGAASAEWREARTIPLGHRYPNSGSG
jgi:hypothetical protein